MINITTSVGQSVGIPIMDTTGITTFPTLNLLTDNNTNVSTPNAIRSLGMTGLSTPLEIGLNAGIYSVVFSATATGNYYVSYRGLVVAHIRVESQDIMSLVKDIQDEALGSWVWNKAAGTLTMIRSSGTTLSTYSVVDSLTTSSRNRLT